MMKYSIILLFLTLPISLAASEQMISKPSVSGLNENRLELSTLEAKVAEEIKDLTVNSNTKPLFESLLLLRTISPSSFEQAAQEILLKKLKAFLTGILESPSSKAFEGSTLSLSNVINKTCELALNSSESDEGAFLTLLLDGSEMLIPFENQIAGLLPSFMTTYPYSTFAVLKLIKSPSQIIRITAFKVLTTHLTTLKKIDQFTQEIEKLLQSDLANIIGEKPIDSYRYFEAACRQNNSIYCLQFLWLRLAALNTAETMQLLTESIQAYFKLPRAQDPASTLKFLITDALATAIASHSLPIANIRSFLIQANETGLTPSIDVELQKKWKMAFVKDEKTPRRERCEFVSDLVLIHDKQHTLEVLTAEIEKLENGMFKEYAKTILSLFVPQSTYDYFKKREKLLKYNTIDSEFIATPMAVSTLLTDYYNCFPRGKQIKDPKKIHISISGCPLVLEFFRESAACRWDDFWLRISRFKKISVLCVRFANWIRSLVGPFCRE